jgi:raffinose/stachyose/melibiose transport system substrate-binding protein
MLTRRALALVSLLILLSVTFVACVAAPPAAAPAAESPATAPEEDAADVAAEEPAAAAGPSQEGVVELKYFYRVTQPNMEANIKWFTDTFNERNKDRIHVTGYSVDGETYKTKITIELRAPEPPDIFFSWEGGRAKALIDNGYVAVLDEYYEKYGWEDILNPAGVGLATYDGHKYFVPTEMAASVVWYRPDIFEQYDLTVPATWDELMANAEVLKANGVAPFMEANQQRWPAQFLWSAILVNKSGVDTYNQLLANEIPWTDERVVEAFTIVKDMLDNGMFIDGVNSLDVSPAVVPFSEGKAAMWYQGSFMLGRFRGDLEQCCLFPVDFFPFPKIGEQEPTISVFAEDTLMMHANSPHKDEAAEFLNWVISTEAQQMKMKIDKPFPANTQVDLSVLAPLEQRLGETMANSGYFTFMHVDHAFEPAIADTFLDSLQAVLGDAMTPLEAAEATEAEAVLVRGEIASNQ